MSVLERFVAANQPVRVERVANASSVAAIAKLANMPNKAIAGHWLVARA